MDPKNRNATFPTPLHW